MKPIYLDYNATTPVDPQVVKVMLSYLESRYGNPSSSHIFGVEPRAAVEKARLQVSTLLNARPDEILFTSGGTESNNFAIKGVALAQKNKGNHLITSVVEHPAVTEVCRYLEKNGYFVTWLPVDQFGRVDPDDVRKAITPKTILITVMHANNETGTIQPIEAIGKLAREHGILFHSDAAQSVGKVPVDVDQLRVDLLTVAGHKLYAPKGVGALYVRRGVILEKLIHGADHESNQRAGTENVTGIVGLGMAAEVAGYGMPDTGYGILDRGYGMREMRDRLYDGIRRAIPDIRLNGHPDFGLPNTLSLGFRGVDAAILLQEMKGVAASAGAACHSDQAEVSGVLTAMGVPMEFAAGTVRFSTGRMTTVEEIDQALTIIAGAYGRVRRGAGDGIPDSGYWMQDAGGGMQDKGYEGEADERVEHEVRLTEFTHSLGCACKIRPQLLEKILKGIPPKTDPAVLVGHETSDDAAVYKIDENTAIVQTVDFIPPVVDDPYMYGAISAANSLSDVYAMGGKPLFALGIVGFPDRSLPAETLQQILRGANDKVAEAGIQVIGGHSIEDSEPKFGLAVTGIVHPEKIIRNATAKPGDSLVLTKPIGTGIITTAIKRRIASSGAAERVMKVMAELNRVPAEIMAGFPVNACTDVTGFGLLGHLKEMVCGAGVQAVLYTDRVPVMDAAWQYAAAGMVPGGTKNNLDFVREFVHWHESTSELMKFILADAQTSGGLLISLPAGLATAFVVRLKEEGCMDASIIGRIESGEPAIRV